MLKNVIKFVHALVDETVTKNDVCIDATCGNGNDTLYLAKRAKHVYAFDIQEMAIQNTKKLLSENNISNVTMVHDSHSKVGYYVQDKVKAVMFNLGYLPGSDKRVITLGDSTISAIRESVHLLDHKGIITIILYIGHDGGYTEAIFVEEFVKALPKNEFQVIKYDFLNREKSPYVIVIEKQ